RRCVGAGTGDTTAQENRHKQHHRFGHARATRLRTPHAAIAACTDLFMATPRKIEDAEGVSTAVKTENAYFDTGRNLYWVLNQRGGWIALNETQFKRILRQQGVSPRVPQDSHVSPLDERLIEVQQTCDVHYAGAPAGYAAGVYNASERRILVTESPRTIEPQAGVWP